MKLLTYILEKIVQYIKLSSALRELLEGLVIIGICSAVFAFIYGIAAVFAFIYGMNFVRYL